MTFTGLSPLILALGVPAIAALLFALQQLRIRHKVVRLPAAMLWARAARDLPARTLRERFRYWLAFLMALAIALLLWLAAGVPRAGGAGPDGIHLFYLDDSAVLSGPGTFDAAKSALLADADAIPANRRAVYLGGGEGTLLLARGENIALLNRRLGGVKRTIAPSSFSRWIGDSPEDSTVHYYGGARASRAGAADAPAGVTVANGYLAPAEPDNRGIVNLGIAPARSGDWDKVDLLVEMATANGAPLSPADLVFTRGEERFEPDTIRADGDRRAVIRDLDADGTTIGVALRRGDDFPADDTAAIRLPERSRIAVTLAPGVPASIRAVVTADPALRIAPKTEARVFVRRAQDAADPHLPDLVLTGSALGGDSFTLAWPGAGGDDYGTAALDATGIAAIDTALLADALNRPVTLGLLSAPRRSVTVWTEIVAQPDFARSSDLPLLVSRSLRWLAEPEPLIAFAGAGAALPESSELGSEALNDRPLLPAGGNTIIGNLPIEVSLLDRQTTLDAAYEDLDGLTHPSAFLPSDWLFMLLALIAGALLTLEWHLYRKGWMP